MNIAASGLETILNEKFPQLNGVTVTRNANSWCACDNAYDWFVTMIDADDDWQPFTVNTGSVGGVGGTIAQPTIVKDLTKIGGVFTLSHGASTTRNITCYATENQMKTYIEEDLGLPVVRVQSGNTAQILNDNKYDLPELGRIWKVTFGKKELDFGWDLDAPTLVANYEGTLTGEDAYVWTHVGNEAKQSLTGNFTVAFRESAPTRSIRYDSSAAELESALEELASINDVAVARSTIFDDIGSNYGYAYTITFNSVNVNSKFGYLFDKDGRSVDGNMPPVVVDSAGLFGYNAESKVEYVFGSGNGEDAQSWWKKLGLGNDETAFSRRRGSGGLNAGEVTISRKNGEQWQIETVLKPNDIDSNDQFGLSVSLNKQLLLVGAPSKELWGDAEQQIVNCTASAGSFTLSFRGFTSGLIPFNANLLEIEAQIKGNYPHTSNIHPLVDISLHALEGWNGERNAGLGFCDGDAGNGHSFVLTFGTPSGGNTVFNVTGDLELITSTTSDLTPTTGVDIKELRKGKRAPNGDFFGKPVPGEGYGLEAGAAYLFEEVATCTGLICNYHWNEIAKFDAMDTDDEPQPNQQFGYSVSSGEREGYEYMMVGSPGSDHQTGKVYFFRKLDGVWR